MSGQLVIFSPNADYVDLFINEMIMHLNLGAAQRYNADNRLAIGIIVTLLC